MSKSADAFRTISEVAEWLDTPAHVLRFWESKFSQVKPVKRAGGRRYYRPSDMALLAGLKKLLHEDGLTIKGAQKVLREQGVKHVASLVPEALEDEAATAEDAPYIEVEPPLPEDTLVAFPTPEAEPDHDTQPSFDFDTPPAEAETAPPAEPDAVDLPEDAPQADFAEDIAATQQPDITGGNDEQAPPDMAASTAEPPQAETVAKAEDAPQPDVTDAAPALQPETAEATVQSQEPDMADAVAEQPLPDSDEDAVDPPEPDMAEVMPEAPLPEMAEAATDQPHVDMAAVVPEPSEPDAPAMEDTAFDPGAQDIAETAPVMDAPETTTEVAAESASALEPEVAPDDAFDAADAEDTQAEAQPEAETFDTTPAPPAPTDAPEPALAEADPDTVPEWDVAAPEMTDPEPADASTLETVDMTPVADAAPEPNLDAPTTGLDAEADGLADPAMADSEASEEAPSVAAIDAEEAARAKAMFDALATADAAQPGLLTRISEIAALNESQIAAIAPHIAQLSALHQRISAPPEG